MSDYSNITIIPPNFPPLYQLPDGRWQRVWEIQLNHERMLDFTPTQEKLSNAEVEVILIQKGKIVYLQVTTTRWQLDDDLIVYTFKIFEVVNAEVLGIDTIQGQEKKVWVRSLRYR